MATPMHRPLVLLCLVASVALTGCPKRDPRAPAARSAASAALPSGTEIDVAIDDTKAFLDGLRGQFHDPGAGVPIPANAGEILERWAALPEQVRRHIPETTRLRAIWFRVGTELRSVAAVRVRRESNVDHPLGVEISLFDGAPGGAKWIAGRPAAGTPVMALKDDVLLVADDVASLGTALAWLTTTAMSETVEPGMRARVPGAAIATSLRGALDAHLEESMDSAVASVRAESARHSAPPTFGDPLQFVSLVRDRARRIVAYLPDARGATITVDAGASGVHVEANLDVTPGSPLARMLATLPVGAPFGFSALPASTAVAVSTRRDPGEASWSELVASIAGSRMSPDDRAALEQVASTMATMRGDASVVAIGAHMDGPFVLAALEPSVVALDPEQVRSVVSIPYFSGLIGTVMGCDDVRVGSMATGRTTLCRPSEGPYPELLVQRGEGANVLMLASRSTANAPPHHAGDGLAASPDADLATGMFHDPDAQRALAALGDETVVVGAISARGVIPALGLLGVPEIRRLAASRTLPTSAAPLVFGVSRESQGHIVGRVIAPPHALEELWAIAYLLTTLAGG